MKQKYGIDKVEGEFELVMSDHHTDMQMPMVWEYPRPAGWTRLPGIQIRAEAGLSGRPPCMEAEADGNRVVGINEEN